ncbi:MFS transporter [Niabella ginsengisoli]|uniref:MFS transporter n=1 Tax=Niabella ginsengisoli TaxID=522298 RepID=A0ABS9SIR2_9BACT|nr:MFS transporter [Niabella ginsengisoli]MCH5598267.1 MFS transporter [Niabella ginsengisoli]
MNNRPSFRRQQWQMLLGTMFCYLFFYTGRHNFGWAVNGMSADLGISYTAIGWISSSMLIGYAVGQLINGNLSDKYSPRKMTLIGGLLSVAANLAISFSHTYTMVLILWTLNGYFQSLAWPPGSRLISNWWGKSERGKAFGLYTAAAGASSVLTFLLSILLVQQGSSWQSLFRLPVLFLLVAVIAFYFIVRDKPSDKGFEDLHQMPLKTSSADWKERYMVVFKNWKFMIASLAMGFESMARYGLIYWVPAHYLGNSWENDPHNLWATILMPLGMVVGALLFGAIADKMLNHNQPAAIRLGMLISAVIAFLIFLVPIQNSIISGALMFFAGFFVYGPQSNFWPMSPDLLGEQYVGTGVGIMNMSAYVFAAIGEPFFGYIIDRTGNTANVFIVIMVICLMCAAVISTVNYKRKKILLIK